MSDVLVIGSGPAGISAALYAVRGGLTVSIITKGQGSLQKADKIENYYGLATSISGAELTAIGEEQAKKLGVTFIKGEVVHLGFEDTLLVKTSEETYKAQSVILATGAARNKTNINGLSEFEGKGVSYCAVCDAFFYRGKNVAVLGNGDFAISEAKELIEVAQSVLLLTNGQKAPTNLPLGVLVNESPIEKLTGAQTLEEVHFKGGQKLKLAGLFMAIGIAGSSELARKLGAEVQGQNIVTDVKMATNIKGLYAAGDCTGGLLQVAKAVHEGAQAGLSALQYVRAHKQNK